MCIALINQVSDTVADLAKEALSFDDAKWRSVLGKQGSLFKYTLLAIRLEGEKNRAELDLSDVFEDTGEETDDPGADLLFALMCLPDSVLDKAIVLMNDSDICELLTSISSDARTKILSIRGQQVQ